MLTGLAELVSMRELERERQLDHRRDRKRKATGRALGAAGDRGLTVREMDEQIAAEGTLTTRAIDAAIAEHGPINADLRAKLVELVDQDVEAIGSASWWAALVSIRWTSADWEVGRFVLTVAGARKLARCRLLAFRGALALRAGYGSRALGTIDAWWIVLARGWLADHELGRVVAAAEWLGTGRHDEPTLLRALDAIDLDDNALARLAVERWRRLRVAGWGEIRRVPARRG